MVYGFFCMCHIVTLYGLWKFNFCYTEKISCMGVVVGYSGRPMTTLFKKLADAEKVSHTLSAPSKMPCYSYSTPAKRCIVGMKMRSVEGSVCASCYACKGFYGFPDTQAALEKRFQTLTDELWEEAMVYLIGKKEKSGFFRWHDSGDLQGTWHLQKIVNIANRLPHIKFWLPTREYSIVSQWFRDGGIKPDNLTIRLSALMMDGEAPEAIAKRFNLVVSGVTKTEGYTCPAPNQENKCLECRACWSQETYAINYKKH